MPSKVDTLVNVGIVPPQAKVIADTIQTPQIMALATVATPDATDLATAITLANALKARLNLVITALKAS